MYDGPIMGLLYLLGGLGGLVTSISLLFGIVYCFIKIFKYFNRAQNPDYIQIPLNINNTTIV
jgi:hypothetical protein